MNQKTAPRITWVGKKVKQKKFLKKDYYGFKWILSQVSKTCTEQDAIQSIDDLLNRKHEQPSWSESDFSGFDLIPAVL